MDGRTPPRWAPLETELAHWQQAGAVARLWLRDDDAVSVTPALGRLAGLCATFEVPYLIAAIPSRAGRDLAERLACEPLAEAAAHGWTHQNHAGSGPKAEFPIDRPEPEILDALTSARTRIDELFGPKAVPIYVPPWNRIATDVEELLPEAGFRAVSTIGRSSGAHPALRRVNVHLDIIDWHGSRGCRSADMLAAELAEHLALSRENGRPAIGVLTHHLDHDEAAWRFLEELFQESVGHVAVCWVSASQLLER